MHPKCCTNFKLFLFNENYNRGKKKIQKIIREPVYFHCAKEALRLSASLVLRWKNPNFFTSQCRVLLVMVVNVSICPRWLSTDVMSAMNQSLILNPSINVAIVSTIISVVH